MMKKKMKKIVGYLIPTVMFFLLFLVTPQGVRAEETQDPTDFSDAKLIGNGTWTNPDDEKTYNIYCNDDSHFKAASDKAPERGPAYIELDQAYKTRMDNRVGDLGGIYDPGSFAYYYFTLEKPAKVTIYGQCSTDANSSLVIQKMDKVGETFQPSTTPLGKVQGTDVVKSMSASLTEGTYLVTLNWGGGTPTKVGTCYSYIKVNADYNMNRETDSVWNETFPNSFDTCTPYKIGKVMNGVTRIGITQYEIGYYSFTLSEKTQFHLTALVNVNYASVYPKDGGSSLGTISSDTNNALVLEPGDYILEISFGREAETYSFNSYTSAVPAVPANAGVDTSAEEGWSVSGETVTINNLNVDSEFCIWSGDKENAGYGKGTARLVIKGNCYIRTLVIDCPVEVLCEEGAQLVVGELAVEVTELGADGKLTYVGGTTYNAATKTFEVRRETPTTPENPTTPETPATPENPTNPENPTTPVNPTTPGNPATPVKPGDSLTDTSTKVEYNVINTEGSIPEVACTGTIDKKAKTVTIPDKVEIDGVTYKVTKVDDGAFKGNKTVTTVKVPSSVTTIGKDAFNGCSKLKTVSISKNVTEIGKNAFKGCAALTKITLPSKCTKIGANAFNGCKKMKTITIKSTKLTSKSISSGAFKGLSKSVTIKVPKKQLKAYKKLLEKKGFKGKVKA